MHGSRLVCGPIREAALWPGRRLRTSANRPLAAVRQATAPQPQATPDPRVVGELAGPTAVLPERDFSPKSRECRDLTGVAGAEANYYTPSDACRRASRHFQ
jgi:hypothetical protein